MEKLRAKSISFQWAMQLVGMVEQSFETRYAGGNTQMHHLGNIQLHPALVCLQIRKFCWGQRWSAG